MLRFFSILLTSLFFTSFSFGQTFYLKYDETCLNRFEYSSSQEATAYISYRMELGGGKMVQFDIGKENVKWVRELPGKLTPCSRLKVDKESIRKLNSGYGKLFIVRESPTHYNVSEVIKAIFIDNYQSGVEVVMNDAEFVLDMSRLISNGNIAKPSSQLGVFLDGTISYQCLKGYIVKKMENFNSDNFKEYVVIPELGIVEKRAISEGGRMVSGKVKLNRVDMLSFTEKVNEECDGIQASVLDDNPMVNDNQVNQGTNTSTETTTAPVPTSLKGGETKIPDSFDSSPCGPTVKGYHYVSKGETLFSISRRYGVKVDELKSWNSLQGSTISVCQKLRVSEQQSSGSGTTSTGGNSGGLQEKGGAGNEYDIHLVRPGESVAALANMYGFTEERFRKMNNLSPFERIYAGQELRTSDCGQPMGTDGTDDRPQPYEEEFEIVETLDVKGNPDVYFRPVKVHQVRKSETLFSIAKQYNTTVDRVKELNGMSGNAKLSTGQRLYVQ